MKYIAMLFLVSLTACYDDEFDTGGFSVPSLITFEGGLDESVDPLLRNKLTFTPLDAIEVTVNATNLNELAVTAVRSDGTSSLGTLPIANEQGTLTTSWSELGDIERIDFTGEAGSEQPYTKRLEIIQTSPFTLNYEADGESFDTPGAVASGESFPVYYQLATANEPVEQVTFAQRIGGEGEFTPVTSVAVGATTADQQQITLTMPSEEAFGEQDALSVRVTITGTNGLTYEEVINIAVLRE